ncbi:hypothetical protein FKM82_021904 [Ascaphus truei]
MGADILTWPPLHLDNLGGGRRGIDRSSVGLVGFSSGCSNLTDHLYNGTSNWMDADLLNQLPLGLISLLGGWVR